MNLSRALLSISKSVLYVPSPVNKASSDQWVNVVHHTQKVLLLLPKMQCCGRTASSFYIILLIGDVPSNRLRLEIKELGSFTRVILTKRWTIGIQQTFLLTKSPAMESSTPTTLNASTHSMPKSVPCVFLNEFVFFSAEDDGKN